MRQEKDFESLFRDCYAPLYAFAMGMVKDEEACRDILSAAFELLWDHFEELDANHRKSYVYRIVRNKCVDLVRHDKYRQRYEAFYLAFYGDESDDDDLRLKETERDIETVCQLIETLSPQTRLVLELCYFKGKKQAEVAEQLGISVSAVKKHIAKAMKVFREHLNLNNPNEG